MGAVREAHVHDVAEIAALIDRKREEYREYAPEFWRPAEDAATKHQAFLRFLVEQQGTITLVVPGTDGLDGAIFALRRPDDWLVDDFAVRTGEQWAGPGRVLLDAVLGRVGGDAVTVVCGQRDVPKRTMLADAGGRLREEWWVRPLGDLSAATGPPTGATARLITAPPVYDPGGPVGQLVDWDGSGEALQAAAAWARGEGAVVLIAPVDASDPTRRERLADAGFYVASEWYAFGGEGD